MTSLNEKWAYPPATSEPNAVTTFNHGSKVASPYGWLENLNSKEVKDFMIAQNKLTSNFLDSCKDLEEVRSDLKKICKQKKISCPTESVGKLFFFMSDENPQGKEFNSLYVQESVDDNPKLLVSPEEIPGQGKYFLRMYSVSFNCEVVAYAYSASKDSEWMCIRFRMVHTGNEYEEELRNVCKSDICWTHDHQGILYSCFLNPKERLHHKIVFHRPGTPQLDDIILVEFPMNPAVTLQAQISDSGSLIFVYAQENSMDPDIKNSNHFFYGDLTPSIETDYEWTPLLYHLFEEEKLDIQYITNDNNFTYFRTNIRAANYRVVRCRLFHENLLARSHWETIISQDRKRLLDWAVCVNRSFLMVCYLQHSVHALELRKLRNGTLIHKYDLSIGTIRGYYGDKLSSRFFFIFTSFLIPDRVQCIRVRQNRSGSGLCAAIRRRKNKKIQLISDNRDLEKALNLSRYCVQQIFIKNKKNVEPIPAFVMHKKGLKMNGSSPCIVYGQGCFGTQVMPSFSIPKIMFLKRFNGVIAIVGTRGGGECGEKWYHQGSLLKKQATYDDFISAVEHLIKSGYTSPSKLILEGEIFGGNLAGVCLIQRPDLFRAVIIHDGLLDMLSFNKFPQCQQWKSEFGDPEDAKYFKNLTKLSPLQNVPTESKILSNFPSVLLLIGRKPCLVHASDSLKFIAQLQNNIMKAGSEWKPILLRLAVTRASNRGENIDGELSYKINERADIFAFILQTVGVN